MKGPPSVGLVTPSRSLALKVRAKRYPLFQNDYFSQNTDYISCFSRDFYSSPIRKLNPNAFGMDLSGYGTPNVFANDQVEQQKLKTLNIKFMRMDLKYSTSGDPTSKIVCAANGCDTQLT